MADALTDVLDGADAALHHLQADGALDRGFLAETIRALIAAARERERTALFQTGTFVLHSGATAGWKIECDSLTSADWAGLAAMAVERIGPFGEVVGVPRGGLPFDDSLRPYATKGPRLVVDDVLTTGASMLEVMRPGDKGLVAFARGPLPEGIEALFVTGDVARERDALRAAADPDALTIAYEQGKADAKAALRERVERGEALASTIRSWEAPLRPPWLTDALAAYDKETAR